MKKLLRSIVPIRLWAALRVWRLNRSITAYKRRQVRHRYLGVDLTVELADHLAEGWYDHDWDMSTEFKLLGGHGMRPGALVFDIGAHQGVVACVMAKLVNPGGRVVAVEAQPHNAKVAEQNRALNSIDNLVIIHGAGASQPGELSFGGNLNGQVDNGKGGWGQFKVRAITIDELTAQYGMPDVLFIDVEGFEIDVLRGAAETLNRFPDVFVEVHVGFGLETFGGSPTKVAEFLPTEKYDLIMFSDQRPDPLPFDPKHALTKERFFLLALSKCPPRAS